MQRVEETAYAKLNLTLAVTGRRADGYHTIQSLFQSISLCDRLVLERREIGFTLNDVEKIPAGENITNLQFINASTSAGFSSITVLAQASTKLMKSAFLPTKSVSELTSITTPTFLS